MKEKKRLLRIRLEQRLKEENTKERKEKRKVGTDEKEDERGK